MSSEALLSQADSATTVRWYDLRTQRRVARANVVRAVMDGRNMSEAHASAFVDACARSNAFCMPYVVRSPGTPMFEARQAGEKVL